MLCLGENKPSWPRGPHPEYNIESMNNNLKYNQTATTFKKIICPLRMYFSYFNFHGFAFFFYDGNEKLNLSNNRICHRISIDS